MRARFPTAASTACSWRAPSATWRASASWTRRWCSRRAPARRSCSARRPGASSRSRTIACSSPLPRASRARCRSGRARARAVPSSSARAIGKLVRELRRAEPRRAALARLQRDHGLDRLAAENLLHYLDDQQRAVDAVPDDRTILIERSADELGRLAGLGADAVRQSRPRAVGHGGRPPSLRDERGLDVEVMWSDDGFVVRVPEGDQPPDSALFVPDPDDVEGLVVRQLGATAMFAARFREAAGRALLLPAPAAGRARAAVAAAQARGGSAGRGRALRIVPDHPRDLPRVPARHLRRAGAGRSAGTRPQPIHSRDHRGRAHAVARSPRRCSSATSPTTSTTATRRWPNAAPRRWRWTRRSSAS